MLSVLFNPNGRIGPRAFWRGLILLVGAMVLLSVAAAYGGMVGALLSLLTYVAPYAYLCVFGKRLHDAGHSAWWFLAFLVAYFILSSLLQAILLPILTPRAAELQEEMQLLMEQGQLADALAYLPEIQREGVLTSLICLVAVNAGLGFIVARLKSDPNNNAYGPPPGLPSDTF